MPPTSAVNSPPHGPLLPVLALDTATEFMAIGLHAGGRAHTRNAAGGAAASAQLIPLIQGLLAEAGLALADLNAVAFGQGPGAFTGLRTACAVAQGLGFGLGRPLLPLCSLLVVAEDARAQLPSADSLDVAVLMDARMDQVYAARFAWHKASGWQVVLAPALLALPDLAGFADAPVVAGSALSAFGQRLPLAGAARQLPQEQDRAGALLRLALHAAQTQTGINPALALPLYLRDKVALTSAERADAKTKASTAAAVS
jgi:tRNA threonylcarbamoyladenosine biosynthesis protein TsaB